MRRRVVLGVSGVGFSTFVLPRAASAASFDGTTLSAVPPDTLAAATSTAGDGVHDVVLTVTLTDEEGSAHVEATRVDLEVTDDQGAATSTTIDGESAATAATLSTTGTVTFAIAFPAYADYLLNITSDPAATSNPAGVQLTHTHSTVPGAPTGVAGTAGDGQVTLTWSAPADDGGTSITGYQTRHSTDSGSTWSTWTATGTSTVGTTITSLTNGTGYVFQVRATNTNGNGTASDTSSEIVPSGTPGAPTGVTGTAGDGQVTLTWSAPADDGGTSITGYQTRHSTDSGSTWSTWTATGTSTVGTTITSLTNGTGYVFQVRASNENGWGPASSNSASVTPTSPTGYSASFVQGQVPSTEAVEGWATFRASLTGTYTSFTLSSSLGQSVTVSHGTLVQQLADGLRSAMETLVTIDGVNWGVGLDCGPTGAVEFFSGSDCSCAANSVLRPDIGNDNWGGIGTTCNAASQTLSLDFS